MWVLIAWVRPLFHSLLGAILILVLIGKSVDLAHLLFLHNELVPFYFKDRSFPSFGILDNVALTRELALYSFKEKYDLFWHARHVGANSVFVTTLAKSFMASTP